MSTILDYIVNGSRKSSAKQQTIQTIDPAITCSSNSAHPKVLKPQLDSNMGIMQNMESVMKSLKRRSKHKKHRQKRATKALGDKEPDQGDGENVRSPTIQLEESSEEDGEPLATLKSTWLSTTRREAPKKSDPDKKNAFQMLMLNGKASVDSASTSPSGENHGQAHKVCPDGGKRKLSSGQAEHVKRRKVRSSTEGGPKEAATTGGYSHYCASFRVHSDPLFYIPDTSPKSPIKKRRKKKLYECYVETIDPKKPVAAVATPVIGTIDAKKPGAVPVTVTQEEESSVTPSRPRRSCAANVIYRDGETSPVSSKPRAPVSSGTPSTAPKTILPAAVSDLSPVIIDVEDSDRTPPPPAETSGQKLAPLFYKALAKPLVDPKVREARQSFLMSDLPDKLRQEMAKKRQVQDEADTRQLALFPEVCHVPLTSGEMYLEIYDEQALFPRPSSPGPPDTPLPRTHSVLRPRTTSNDNESSPLPAMAQLRSDYQKKQLVRHLKADGDGKFPAYKFYKALAKRATRDQVGALFADKFRPTHSSEFVFNLGPVQELKEYLESFNAAAEGVGSSYETDDDDECSSSTDAFGGGGVPQRQTLVLHGSSSVGKTSAVYAIAHELNYNVIEINASSKRNGAKVLHALSEATQSHKVATKGAAEKSLSLSRKIVRRMEREEQRMSIIFIEDVDVIFAEDTGFLAALTQLMSLTKRPIILTTNNRDSPNLRKMFDASQSFRFLHFRRPTHAEDCLTYLHLVGIVQGCNFDPDYLRHLFEEVCRRDLRQGLLQLNFITLTSDRDLTWSGESAVVDIPCLDLGLDEGEGEDSCLSLAWTMDQLCAADRWGVSRGVSEMSGEFREMCRVGSKRMDSRCDGQFYREAKYNGDRSM